MNYSNREWLTFNLFLMEACEEQCAWLDLLDWHGDIPSISLSITGHFEPGLLVVELFHILCTSEVIIDKCLCKDEITNALLSPISAWLDDSTVGGNIGNTFKLCY